MERIYLSPPDMSGLEREALIAAFDSGWIAPVGPDLAAFETAMTDVLGLPQGGAVALSSGTAALHLGLRLAGVGVGDEVWTSTLTFVFPLRGCGRRAVSAAPLAEAERISARAGRA